MRQGGVSGNCLLLQPPAPIINTESERRLVLIASIFPFKKGAASLWFDGYSLDSKSNQRPLPAQTDAVYPKYVLNRYLMAWACSQDLIRAVTA